jgi:hypothetical protein
VVAHPSLPSAQPTPTLSLTLHVAKLHNHPIASKVEDCVRITLEKKSH